MKRTNERHSNLIAPISRLELNPQSLGEPEESEFSRAVVDDAIGAINSERTCHVDDMSAISAHHIGQEELAEADGGENVELEYVAHLGVGELEEALAFVHGTSVVHKDVDWAPDFMRHRELDPCEEVADLRHACEVRLEEVHAVFCVFVEFLFEFH